MHVVWPVRDRKPKTKPYQKEKIMADLTCPKCKSENTQKLSAIVDSGTSRSVSQSVGAVGGTVGGSAAFGTTSSTTNTFTQSNLAKKLSAPAKKKTILVLVGFAFLMLLAGGMMSLALFRRRRNA